VKVHFSGMPTEQTLGVWQRRHGMIKNGSSRLRAFVVNESE
jgi:hypothetical protein